MSTAAEIRSRIDRSRPGTFFSIEDYSLDKRSAAETAFSRLASDRKIKRVRRGLYWKPHKTRFGTSGPSAEIVLERVLEGRGFGPTGWSAANALGLTSQVPARPSFVVFGPIPTGTGNVRISSRWNLERLDLAPLEIAALEILREYPRYVDVDWPELKVRLLALDRAGRVRLNRVIRAARNERSRRVRDLAGELSLDDVGLAA